MWYTSAEQPLRLETYYCTNGIATMLGGLIGYAVGHIKTGLPRWMYVFLIFGSASTIIGIAILLFNPRPSNHSQIPDSRPTHHRRRTRLRKPAGHQEQPLQTIPSLANRARPENLDPLHNGDRRTTTEFSTHFLLLHHHKVLRCRHPWNTIPTNPRRCRAIRIPTRRRVYMHPIPQQSVPNHDSRESNLHHRRIFTRRPPKHQ